MITDVGVSEEGTAYRVNIAEAVMWVSKSQDEELAKNNRFYAGERSKCKNEEILAIK